MNSIRERVLREIVTRLASAIAPTPVLRMPAVPVTREASPALLLFVDGDSITAHANHLVDWHQQAKGGSHRAKVGGDVYGVSHRDQDHCDDGCDCQAAQAPVHPLLLG